MATVYIGYLHYRVVGPGGFYMGKWHSYICLSDIVSVTVGMKAWGEDHLLRGDVKCISHHGRKQVGVTRLAITFDCPVVSHWWFLSSPWLERVNDEEIMKRSYGLASEAAPHRTGSEGISFSLTLRAPAAAVEEGGCGQPWICEGVSRPPDHHQVPEGWGGTIWREWEAWFQNTVGVRVLD